MFHANRFTAKLIDELLDLERGGVISIRAIACEVPFLDNKRKADILLITNENTIAIEIKSEADSLAKLSNQLTDYKNTFSQVYLAANVKHTTKIKKSFPRSPGIIQEEKGEFSILRNAKTYKNPIKKNLVSLFTKDELSRALELSTSKKNTLDLQQIREMCLKSISQKDLFRISKENLTMRYKKNYEIFLSERGKETHTDDLLQLSRKHQSAISSKFRRQ